MERLCRMAGESTAHRAFCHHWRSEATGAFLAAGTGRGTVIPRIESKGVRWRLSMEHFYVQDQQAAAEHLPEQALPELAPKTDTAPAHADPGIGYIFEHTRGKKCLVFVNSREECEAVTTTLRQYCEARHEPDRFLIHHGNLSSAYRETAETAMKDDDLFLTTVTTATLELGIDIGRLERAFQVDAPFTVSSFLQRMGRTGRRDLPPEMWFVIREDPPEARALLPTTIPWKLLQGIALVQVYLEERWVEPPRLDRLPYSLLYHQTMCTLASCGEMTPAALASRVLTLSYFHRVSQEDFKLLLRHLLEIDHIQRTETGGLIVGIAGERLTSSYKFYAVFQENVEYTVRWNSQELGTIVQPPPVGEKIAIAGHVWVVDEIDHKRHTVYCEQIKGKVPAYSANARRYPHPHSGTHETGAAGIQAVSLSHAECGSTITAGTAHGAELRADGRAADLSGRRYVVPVPLAGDVRLSRHGALSQDTLRRIPHPHRAVPVQTLFHPVQDESGQAYLFPGAAGTGAQAP
ncbi:MAG: helicase-related protein [Ruminococcus sp.]